MQRTFRTILTPQPEGSFVVTAPSLPGCVAWGGSLDEGREAIDRYLEDMAAGGKDVPDDSQSLELPLTVAWLIFFFPAALQTMV